MNIDCNRHVMITIYRQVNTGVERKINCGPSENDVEKVGKFAFYGLSIPSAIADGSQPLNWQQFLFSFFICFFPLLLPSDVFMLF